ncbi:hypothetical protein PV682_15100 [Streptomyces niveiscabiei]|uniref:hypothetical protein n=1 Tax=Streptomyces niveiscabiei TaxID=164115 RepID=UPI0029A06B23|nr:hypothetical protein [Streptomyces niveiscabiei]MDX3382786.1 hypothetical protein [Streptomyces niveiscabiei]
MTRTKVWGTAASVAALTLAGCSTGGASQPAERPAASAAAPVKPAGAGRAAAVVGVPELGGITAVAKGAVQTGNAEYPLPGGMRAGGTLAVAFECEGVGRLTVDVVPGGASFSVPCEKGQVTPMMNEVPVDRSAPAGMLRFSAGAGVVWAFAAGWDKSGRGHGS